MGDWGFRGVAALPEVRAGNALGGGAMPSSEYFRRQADICLRLSLVASDEVVSTLLIAMAQDYVAQADEIEAESTKAMPTIMGPSTSPDGETTEP